MNLQLLLILVKMYLHKFGQICFGQSQKINWNAKRKKVLL